MPFLDALTGLIVPRHAPVVWQPSADVSSADRTSQYTEVEIDGKLYFPEYSHGGIVAYHPVGYSGPPTNPWSGYWDADGNWIS